MPDTITEFNVFTAGNKARSNEVNTNFSNYRGNLLPISPLTATASDQTHDLGSTTHRWKTAFCVEIDLTSSTTTAGLMIKGNTALTTGAFLFQIGGVTKSEITTQGFNGTYLQSGTVAEGALTVTARQFTTVEPGTGNWTVPSGLTMIGVLGCGGGGGGGGAAAYNGGFSGGGGAGGNGSQPIFVMVSVTAGEVLSILIGGGGNGGSGGGGGGVVGQSGSAGAASSMYRSGTLIFYCAGAAGGAGGGFSLGGAAGADSITPKLIQIGGGEGGMPGAANPRTGFTGGFSVYAPGGAGGAASSNAAGGGGGAAGLRSGGAGGAGATNNGGTAVPGGGGGGGGGGGEAGASGAGGTGGNGGNGLIRIIYNK